MQDIGGITSLTWTLDYPRSRQGALVVKRALDLLLAAVLLVVLAPLLAAIAIAVRMTSPGPALFIQRRVGYRCAEFDMFKFRTMTVGAERRQGAMASACGTTFFKVANDPRTTRLGRWLRRLSLDELPQLLNVVKGDMSLVGPRPLLRSDLDRYPRASQMRRFAMYPGLTGLWQVNGRSLLPDEDRIRLDLTYVDNWSVWLDVKVLARTPPVVLTGRGAC
jgi:lipopolysaccharide/colanic/teichoic acid biosynthesis glycosyltransferase